MSEKYADKIAKLLRKAESTTPAEAEALLAKAQELATTYAIDQAMIDAASGNPLTQKIVEDKIEYHSVYSRAMFRIGATIAKNNDCNVMVTNGKDLMRTTLWVIGFEQDVERVKLLNASLQIQAQRAMTAWYAEHEVTGMTQREKFKHRRQFLFSFATGLDMQLRLAAEHGRTVATGHESKRTGTNAADSVALVLRNRKARVQEWQNEQHPNLRTVRSSFRSGSREAAAAGRQAGQHANASTAAGSVGRTVKGELS